MSDAIGTDIGLVPAPAGPEGSKRRRLPASWLLAACFILSLGFLTPSARAATGPHTHSIAVLPPVDVGFQTQRPLAADFLRKGLERSGNWRVMGKDSLAIRLKEASLDPEKPCKEFQCAFDAGSALQVEYVLFGTVASLKEIQAYTVTLLHVPSSQVVWSRAGDIPRLDGQDPAEVLESSLGWAVEVLDPLRFDLRKVPSLGLMAVVDAGETSSHARVVRERAMAHVFASRNYDLIAQEEMEDLLRALDIPRPAEGTPEQEILDIGHKLDVRYVLYSRLTQTHGNYRLELSLHDLKGEKAVRKWPSRQAKDFGRLLRLEDRFFTTLSDPDLPAGPAIPRPSAVRTAGKYASVAVAFATGAGLGWLAWQSKQSADTEYRAFQAARSQEEASMARQRTQESDVEAKRYGLLSGICIVLGAAVWTF